MTPQERKVMELALEALERSAYYGIGAKIEAVKAIKALEEALAKPEQEPVALEALKWIASQDLSGADDRAIALMAYAFVSKARFAVLEATGERA